MSKIYVCPENHEWQIAHDAPVDAPRACPVCGAAGEPREPDRVSSIEWSVLPPLPIPVEKPGFDSSGAATGQRMPLAERSTLLLGRCRPFSALPAEIIPLLTAQMHEQEFPSGALLMRQGERGESLMLMTDGQVGISTRDEAGHAHLICTAGPRELLGEMALLTDEPRTADAVALERVRALVLPAARFHQLARQHPVISVVLTQLVATRLATPGRDVLVGKVFHGCRVRGRLGQGGMAMIYHAEDVETGRDVALKMLSHQLVYDARALTQFRREADLIQSFEHENIVRMHGRFAAFHTYFIVMEYCDGESLDRVLARTGALPEAECRRILGQVCRGLVQAHAAGVVHRDLKPSNIILVRDGTAKLTDFGLACPVSDLHRAAPGVIVGTPQYMAPEQMLGQLVTQQADLFALGCVAWEMLTGVRLFPESDLAALMRRHVEWQAPAWPEICPGASDELRTLVQTCLDKDPGHRRPDLDRAASWAGRHQLVSPSGTASSPARPTQRDQPAC